MSEDITHEDRIIIAELYWQKLADLLGYKLVRCSQSGGSRTHTATLLRPDGTRAEFTLPERDLRRLCEALRRPWQPPRRPIVL
jgi:hypothetical protein